MALRDILLRISGDGDDAKRELAAVAKKVAEFARQEASAKLSVDATRAESVIERAKRELREFGRLSPQAVLDVDILKAEVQLARIRQRLDDLSRQEASPKVDAKVATALRELERVQARLDKLNGASASIDVDVNRSGRGVNLVKGAGGGAAGAAAAVGGAASAGASAAGSLGLAAQAVQGLTAAVGGGGGLVGTLAAGSAGLSSFGLAAGLLGGILAGILITVIVSLIGALTALVASLSAAVAAVTGLAVGLLGVLAPVFVVIIAAVVRFVRIVQALKAQSAATLQAQQKIAQGADAVRAASDGQAAAARALEDANRRLGEASVQAYREMEDAAEAASDAIRGVANAESARDQSSLSTRAAVLALKKLRAELGATGDIYEQVFDKFTDVNVDTSGLKAALAGAGKGGGKAGLDEEQQLKLEQAIQDVRQARLNEADAIDGVSDAERNRTRTQQRANEFARQGIAASEGYRAALRGVEDAQRGVAEAAQRAADANRDLGLAAAQAKANVLAAALTGPEQKLLAVIQSVSKAVRTALGPATDAVFKGLIIALQRVVPFLLLLQPAFTKIGKAIGAAFVTLSGALISPAALIGLGQLADAGARLVGIFTEDLIIPFLSLLGEIAIASLPFLLRGLEKFGDLLRELGDDASASALAGIFVVLVSNLKSVLNLGRALGNALLALFQRSVGPGQGLVDKIAAMADNYAKFLRSAEGQKKVQEFFDKLLPVAGSFVRTVIELGNAFIKFSEVAAPYVETVLDIVRFLLANIRTIGIVVVAALALFAPAFAAGTLAVLGIIQVVRNFRRILDALGAAASAVGRFFRTGFDSAKRTVSDFAGSVARTFSSIVSRVQVIGARIGLGLVSGIKGALGGLVTIGQTIINSLVDTINKGIRLINKATPGAIKILGETVVPAIPDIPEIRPFASGGLVTGPTLGLIGEAGREAVLPLTKRVFGELAAGIISAMQITPPRAGGLSFAFPSGTDAGRGEAGPRIGEVHNHIKVTGRGNADPNETIVALTRAMRRRP